MWSISNTVMASLPLINQEVSLVSDMKRLKRQYLFGDSRKRPESES